MTFLYLQLNILFNELNKIKKTAKVNTVNELNKIKKTAKVNKGNLISGRSGKSYFNDETN